MYSFKILTIMYNKSIVMNIIEQTYLFVCCRRQMVEKRSMVFKRNESKMNCISEVPGLVQHC